MIPAACLLSSRIFFSLALTAVCCCCCILWLGPHSASAAAWVAVPEYASSNKHHLESPPLRRQSLGARRNHPLCAPFLREHRCVTVAPFTPKCAASTTAVVLLASLDLEQGSSSSSSSSSLSQQQFSGDDAVRKTPTELGSTRSSPPKKSVATPETVCEEAALLKTTPTALHQSSPFVSWSPSEAAVIVQQLFEPQQQQQQQGVEISTTGSSSSSSTSNTCGPIYMFDGECNFCNESVHMCYDLDHDRVLRFCSMQSSIGRAILQHFHKAPDDYSSLVVVESARTAHFQSDAVLYLVQSCLSGLPRAVRLAAAVAQRSLPEAVRHAAYHVVADNRHVFGSSEGPTCRVDMDPSRFVDDFDWENNNKTDDNDDVE